MMGRAPRDACYSVPVVLPAPPLGMERSLGMAGPLVRAFGEEQRRVEDNVIILDAERRQRTYATAKQRANLLSQIREVEEKMARSTQAILAAQLAGKVPEGEDVHHFLSNYTRKLELRAQLATLDADM